MNSTLTVVLSVGGNSMYRRVCREASSQSPNLHSSFLPCCMYPHWLACDIVVVGQHRLKIRSAPSYEALAVAQNDLPPSCAKQGLALSRTLLFAFDDFPLHGR